MKKTLLVLAAVASFALNGYSQGMLTFGNPNGTGGPNATSLGLIYQNVNGTVKVWDDQFVGIDLNIQLVGGASQATASVIKTLLLSDGTAIGDDQGGGNFADPSGATINLNGVAASNAGVAGALPVGAFQVLAWTGNYSSYDAAAAAGEYVGKSGWFANYTANFASTGIPLDGMPSFTLAVVPEPSTIALGVMGLSALLFRRRK